jgi:tagatose 1,6-diphosphate aldolase
MKKLSIGKYYNLGRCASTTRGFSILALDHRNNLRNALNPENPDSVKNEVISKLKMDITATISQYASALLLDPEVGAFQVIAENLIPKNVGLVLALESTGYTGDPEGRESNILENWSVDKAKRLGANAVKLLVYYHPDSPTASTIESLVGEVNEDCLRADIPFILEILSYSIKSDSKKLSGIERIDVIIESARKLSRIGCDMLKMEFPYDFKNDQDRSMWAKSCTDLTAACEAPWILLSASVDFQTYLDQVAIACTSGAAGIAVGRAVWKEAVLLQGSERIDFLNGEASERMRRLSSLVSALSRKFTDIYQAQESSYKTY